MKKIYFTVGPSQIYPTLPKHLSEALKQDIPSLNHRGADFKKLYSDLDSNLKKLLGIPKNYEIFFTSSALEAMERTILGTVEKNSYHIITGSFGKAWAKYAEELGKQVIKFEVDLSDLSVIRNSDFIDTPNFLKSELICITQNDTSTGIQIPMEEIYFLKKKYPEKLIAIDVVSSIPYVDIDYSKIDITFFSVQKGFGLPAGLGIMVVSPNALKKTKRLKDKGMSIGSYHSLLNLSEKYKSFQTPETPNVLNIFLLNKVCLDLLKKGIQNVRKETDKKYDIISTFFNNHPKFSHSVKDERYRSRTTIVINTSGETQKIKQSLSKQGFEIGAGYGENKDTQLRIANFPTQNLSDLKKLLNLF